MRMGLHLPSSVFLGLSPPPSLTTEDESGEHNNDSVTTLDTTASTATSCTFDSSTTSPVSPQRVAVTPVNHHSPEQHQGSTATRHHVVSPTTPPPPPLQQQQRLQREWKQKSIVRRASSIVQSEVSQMIQHSTFLNRPDIVSVQSSHTSSSSSSSTTMALFHRSEVQIGSLVGSGGFSNVYRITGFVLDPTISDQCTVEQERQRVIMADRVARGEQKLVLKHLKQSLAHSSTKVMSRAAIDLIMEATYMSSMNHPHILPIRALPVHHIHAYDAGEYDGYFIIMDELSNTLSDEIQEWKTNVSTAPSVTVKMDYALQIASALSYLHSFCQVVYRDLKPSNIGFDINTGTIQIFDFGLCRELPTSIDTPPLGRNNDDESTDIEIEDDVYEMSGVGTRRYMAPEIINDGKYNTKVDVYSWSMLVSELITGIKPYVNYDIETHRVAVCQGGERPHLPFPLYPPWVRTILHNTWCESVTERWSARQVQYYLSKIIREYDNDDDIRTRFEHVNVRPNMQPLLPHFPDSPVDVRRLHEIDIYAADWLLLPDLPDLHNENCSTPGNIAPKRRHTLHPRYEHDDSSGIRFRPTAPIDGSTSTDSDPPPPLTICEVNGNVEMVFGQIIPSVPPVVKPRPFSFQQQYRANSCTVN